jgi:ABC-2 type transport system ATP-binding protein
MIEVQGLTKYYGTTPALQDVTFKVNKGEILGFLGPNGAGKTTTMRILTCYMPATSGTAKVAGYDVFEESLRVREQIGYLPESVPLYTDMDVTSYLEFVAQIKRVPRRERGRKVAAAIERCGLGEVRTKLIGQLSKGYRQRVGLAQALVNDPAVIILDEPTIGLDPRQIVEIRNLIKGLAGEHTVLLSSHNLTEVRNTCQRVIIINRGRIVAHDSEEALASRVQGHGVLRLVAGGETERVLPLLRETPGVIDVQAAGREDGAGVAYRITTRRDADPRAEIVQRLAGAEIPVLELRRQALSLEEIFMRIVSEGDKEVVQ